MENQHGVITLPAANQFHRIALAMTVAGITLVALLTPLASADAALIDRVNEATREAGARVVADRTEAFIHGVFLGHYTTYDQLVGAISYHKEQGTLPSFDATMPTVATQCITGDAISFAGDSISGGSVAIRGDLPAGEDNTPHVVTKTLNMAANQYDIAIERGVGTNSNVTACTADNFASLYGHLTVN